jgi:tellurite resistance-related uncharacterized protein
MPKSIKLPSFSSDKGILSVSEKLFEGDIKRAFHIYDVPANAQRGGHSHKEASVALICAKGTCEVYVKNSNSEQRFFLNQASDCLILEPSDWHIMEHFSADALLLVYSNQYYDPNDIVLEKP